MVSHLLRALLISIIANLAQLIITQILFFLGVTAGLGLGILFLIPVIYGTIMVSIYFFSLNLVTRSNYQSPKKLATLLSLLSIPLFAMRELGIISLNDLANMLAEQFNMLPLTLIVLIAMTFTLWKFQNQPGAK